MHAPSSKQELILRLPRAQRGDCVLSGNGPQGGRGNTR